MDNQKITILDIAETTGFSKSTVGRALGNYGSVSEKKKKIILDTAKKLNYQPNLIARGLRSHKSNTIGIIVGDLKNSYFNNLIYAVEREAKKEDYNVIICNTHENQEEEFRHLRNLYNKQVDGIILVSALKTNKIPKKHKYLYTGNIPLILVDRLINDYSNNTILSKNFHSSYNATKYLLDLGHRKIGIVGTEDFPTILDRKNGYIRALSDYGLSYKKELVIKTKLFTSNHNQKAIANILDNNPDITALYLLNNSLLLGALKEMKIRKLKIPKDISLLVWDDEEINDYLNITTINQSMEEMGKIATKKLFYMINTEEKIAQFTKVELDTNLLVRNSCRDINNI